MLRIKGGVDLHLFKTTIPVKTNIPLVYSHIEHLIIIFLFFFKKPFYICAF